MKKKILSFVLAVTVGLNLGCGSVFGYVNLGNAGDVRGSDGKITKGENLTFKLTGNELDFVKNQGNSLNTMFGYAAGTMVYVATQTGVSYYDSNGFRASFNRIVPQDEYGNRTSGTNLYECTQMAFNSTDIAAIKNSKADGKGTLESFIVGCGISEDSLYTAKTNEKGQFLKADGSVATSAKEAAREKVAWLDTAENWLKQGANFTATINFAASGGAQVTLSENGKAQYTKGTYAGLEFTTANYIYNSDGFLEKVESAEFREQTENGDTEAGAKYEVQYRVTDMDEYGRERGTYITDSEHNRISWNKTTYDETNKVFKTDKDKSYDGYVTENKYSKNGSLLSVANHQTGYVTVYNAGRPDHVLNDTAEGAANNEVANKIVSKYNYTNGVISSVISYNYDYNEDTRTGRMSETAMTVFDVNGREMGTVSLTDWKGTESMARKEIAAARAGNAGSNTPVSDFKVYKDCSDGVYSKGNIKSNGVADNMNYGYTSPIASVSLSTGGSANGVETNGLTYSVTYLSHGMSIQQMQYDSDGNYIPNSKDEAVGNDSKTASDSSSTNSTSGTKSGSATDNSAKSSGGSNSIAEKVGNTTVSEITNTAENIISKGVGVAGDIASAIASALGIEGADGVISTVENFVNKGVSLIADITDKVAGNVTVSDIFETGKKVVGKVIDGAKAVISKVSGKDISETDLSAEGIASAAKGFVAKAVDKAKEVVSSINLPSVVETAKTVATGIVEKVKSVISPKEGESNLKAELSKLDEKIKSDIAEVKEKLETKGISDIKTEIEAKKEESKSTITKVVNTIKESVTNAVKDTATGWQIISSKISDWGDGVKSAAKDLSETIKGNNKGLLKATGNLIKAIF